MEQYDTRVEHCWSTVEHFDIIDEDEIPEWSTLTPQWTTVTSLLSNVKAQWRTVKPHWF